MSQFRGRALFFLALAGSGLGMMSPLRAAAPAGPAAPFTLYEATIDGVHRALQNRQITCAEVVQYYLGRIERYNHRGPALNAVQTVNPNALQEAKALDEQLRGRRVLPSLYCVPVLVKDSIETQGLRTTYGSVIFDKFVPQRDATVVARLKAHGAIILGKATLGELVFGYVGSEAGIIRNAYDPQRNPSGSSAGTAVGLAADFALAGIGEDTGGSIRGPAAMASLVGLRPTLPLVSRFGMLPMSPTRDTVGPITRTVMDNAIVLDAIAGYDPDDPVTQASQGHVAASYARIARHARAKGLRIGYLRTSMSASTVPSSTDHQDIRRLMDATIAELHREGATVVDDIDFSDVLAQLRSLARAQDAGGYETEAAVDAYLSALAHAPVRNLTEAIETGKIIPSRLRDLRKALGKTTEDQNYLQIQQKMARLTASVSSIMDHYHLDALLYPTFDQEATLISSDVETNPSPKDGYNAGNNRVLASLIGAPAITVPAGFTRDALPVGAEFLARPYQEPILYRIAASYEQHTHLRQPPSFTP